MAPPKRHCPSSSLSVNRKQPNSTEYPTKIQTEIHVLLSITCKSHSWMLYIVYFCTYSTVTCLYLLCIPWSGYTIQENNNPPDFFLDVISGDFHVDVETLDPEKTSTGNTYITAHHWLLLSVTDVMLILCLWSWSILKNECEFQGKHLVIILIWYPSDTENPSTYSHLSLEPYHSTLLLQITCISNKGIDIFW